METESALHVLAALAQETRLNIFRLLVEHGPKGLPAGVIGAKLGLANATLSFHLKELSHAELVQASPQGRSIIYSANFQTMNELTAFLTDNCCRGSGEVCEPTGATVCGTAARSRQIKRRKR